MGASKFSEEKQIEIAIEYLMDNNSDSELIGKKYGISGRTVREYASKHQDKVGEYLKNKRRVNKYPSGLKEKALEDIRNGMSVEDVASKHHIKQGTVLKWRSNINKELADTVSEPNLLENCAISKEEYEKHKLEIPSYLVAGTSIAKINDANVRALTHFEIINDEIQALNKKVDDITEKLNTILSLWS